MGYLTQDILGDGLIRTQLRQLGGTPTTKGMTLRVDYVGRLKDGTIFDSSIARGQPFDFTLGSGQVIAGWDLGLNGVGLGDVVKLSIPAALAYGNKATGGIPAGSDLDFEVTLWAYADTNGAKFANYETFGLPSYWLEYFRSTNTITESKLGLDGNDTLKASGTGAIILGLKGADLLIGSASADLIDGGDDDDNLQGGDGSDLLLGGKGNDIISGEKLNDEIYAGDGNDFIHAGNGKDVITGGDGSDEIWGDFGWNTYKADNDNVKDLIVIKSDQWLVNPIYGTAGNSPNGEKCDIIESLELVDRLKIVGVDTTELTFATARAHDLNGIGIYAKGALEALYIGTELNLGQLQSITSGDGFTAARANQVYQYGLA
ncbi:MAG: FKBP-type peptidyl-prolyl cis-trans isomerase [Synechococcus lacustris]